MLRGHRVGNTINFYIKITKIYNSSGSGMRETFIHPGLSMEKRMGETQELGNGSHGKREVSDLM